MSWNTNDNVSENEMFPLSSMQDDNVHVRLLSMSDDDDQERMYTAEIPALNLRNRPTSVRKPLNEEKSRCAVISILIIGLLLIITINIGVAMKLYDKDGGLNIFSTTKPPVNTTVCTPDKEQYSISCNESFPWKSYRLPTSIHPDLYSIFLWPNLTLGTFNGTVNISLNTVMATDTIVLHSKGLNLSNIGILKDGIMSQPKSVLYCEQKDLFAVVLKEKLHVGETCTLTIAFSGNLAKKSLRGLYRSKYSLKSGENFTLATTQFESISAREAFPCFDEPNFKAKFSASIVRDEDYVAVSNMPVSNTNDFMDGLKQDYFDTSLTMSTYLLAFTVSKFASISRVIQAANGPLKVSVYATQDRMDSAEFALNVSCNTILFYENLFKIPYPLPKMDLFAIPDFEAGAMENWGLVTYRETSVLCTQDSSTAIQENVALTIAHEFAHQWFGNLVTMKWWNDLWLNEGFASFMEYYAVDKTYPDWDFMSSFYQYHTSDAMAIDQSKYTHPITVPVKNSVQIESVFDEISYSKGACIIMMMVDYIGADTFMTGVTNYLNKFSYNNTENEDLVTAIAAASNNNNLLDMLKSWTTQPGFPIISVSLNGNKVSLNQVRYTLTNDTDGDHNCGEKHHDLIWEIPMSYSTDLDSTKKWFMFDTKSASMYLSNHPEWILLNINRGGYYVVNYDSAVLTKITQQMIKDHTVFSELNREGLLFNVLKSAKIGLIPYKYVFDLMSYAKSEEDYGPLRLVGSFIVAVSDSLRKQYRDKEVAKLQSLGRSIFETLYHRNGWPEINETLSELSHSKKKLRSLLVSVMCSLDYENCTSEALRRFRLWKDKGVSVHPDFRRTVYTTGIRLGTVDDHEFVWNKYVTDKSMQADEKVLLLIALCRSGDERKILELLLETITNAHVRSQDTSTVLSGLQSTQVGGMLTWRFLRTMWVELNSKFQAGSTMTRRFLTVFGTFIDDVDLAAAEEFVSENHLGDMLYVQRELDQAKFHVHWVKTALPQIIDWLNENIH